MDTAGNITDPIMRARPAWSAAINGLELCEWAEISQNCGSMGPRTEREDRITIENKVRAYLKSLAGLQLTIPISDICEDLNMTEEAVTKILTKLGIQLDDEEFEWNAPVLE